MTEPRVLTCADVFNQYRDVADPSFEEDARDVQLTGTLVYRNRMGADAYFLRVLDKTGGIQLYASRGTFEAFGMIDEAFDAFEAIDAVELHDVLLVRGSVMRTRSGEITIRVRELTVQGKDHETAALNFTKYGPPPDGSDLKRLKAILAAAE